MNSRFIQLVLVIGLVFFWNIPEATAQSVRNQLTYPLFQLDKGKFLGKSVPSTKEQKLMTHIFGQSSDSLAIYYVKLNSKKESGCFKPDTNRTGRQILITKINAGFFAGFLYHTDTESFVNPIPFVVSVRDSLLCIPMFDTRWPEIPEEKYSLATLAVIKFMDFNGNLVGEYFPRTCDHEFYWHPMTKDFEPCRFVSKEEPILESMKRGPVYTITQLDFRKKTDWWFTLCKQLLKPDIKTLPEQMPTRTYPSSFDKSLQKLFTRSR